MPRRLFTVLTALVVLIAAGASRPAAAQSFYEGKTIRVTISGGLSTYPADGQTAAELIAAADAALYQAKERGRNQIVSACAAGAETLRA